MAEIIPDTSKYTDLPNKLRALAVILEEPDYKRREIFVQGDWHHGGTDTNAVIRSMGKFPLGSEYRLKPKPRELWAVYVPEGYLCTYTKEPPPDAAAQWDHNHPSKAPHTVVRFVEQS